MDETRVYAVASGKGGVGKTTTAIALGACAVAAGRSAVVVDADLGMGNLATLLGLDEGGPALHDVLAGEVDVDDAVREGPEGLAVVASGRSLAGYAAADPTELGRVVDALREDYEVVVIDTGAGLSHDTVLPLGLADEVVLVTTPAAIAVDNTGKTREVVERLDAGIGGVVVTRASRGGPDGVGEHLGVPVLGTVPEDDAVGAAAEAGVPVTVHAPDSPAAGAYADAAAALLSVPVTALDFGETATDESAGDEAAAIPFEGDDPASDPDESDGSGADTPLIEDAEPETDEEAPADEDEGGRRSLLSRLSGGLLG